jgi:NAD(P)H dehydrogenase (quinone)
VVGCGVTGIEFANAYTELGVTVTLVASRDRVLPHEDADAAEVIEESFAQRGVKLIKQARAQSVRRTDGGVLVTMTDGRTVEGSHALMTLGSVPNTSRLGLQRVGIEPGPGNYIAVDRVSRTPVAGIYAAGDCTGLLPLASVAAMQGRIAMYHALGEAVNRSGCAPSQRRSSPTPKSLRSASRRPLSTTARFRPASLCCR